jgi:hypothetical protein
VKEKVEKCIQYRLQFRALVNGRAENMPRMDYSVKSGRMFGLKKFADYKIG